MYISFSLYFSASLTSRFSLSPTLGLPISFLFCLSRSCPKTNQVKISPVRFEMSWRMKSFLATPPSTTRVFKLRLDSFLNIDKIKRNTNSPQKSSKRERKRQSEREKSEIKLLCSPPIKTKINVPCEMWIDREKNHDFFGPLFIWKKSHFLPIFHSFTGPFTPFS